MKKRIDVLLVDFGYFASREQARRTIIPICLSLSSYWLRFISLFVIKALAFDIDFLKVSFSAFS